MVVAARGGHIECLEALVRHGASVDKVDKVGVEPLVDVRWVEPSLTRVVETTSSRRAGLQCSWRHTTAMLDASMCWSGMARM